MQYINIYAINIIVYNMRLKNPTGLFELPALNFCFDFGEKNFTVIKLKVAFKITKTMIY